MKRGAVEDLIASLYPGAKIERLLRFGVDEYGGSEITEKGIGYGEPVRVIARDGSDTRDVVIHTASADCFGHDRRADRAAEMLLAYDTFEGIPHHASVVDVGAVTTSGSFRSLRDCGEYYLVTEYRAGSVYADHLRELAHRRVLDEEALAHVDILADYLIELHREPRGTETEYRRSIRDLVGAGEGIFGIADGYPDNCSPRILEAVRHVESQCVSWRWQLRSRTARCRRTHGDFHPFNILFDARRLSVLDAARGCVGDPADDVTCLSVNFAFFADDRQTWNEVFEPLWLRFWQRYLAGRDDDEVLSIAPPFLAWRLLVLANPLWYPGISDQRRYGLLDWATQTLANQRLSLALPAGLWS